MKHKRKLLSVVSGVCLDCERIVVLSLDFVSEEAHHYRAAWSECDCLWNNDADWQVYNLRVERRCEHEIKDIVRG